MKKSLLLTTSILLVAAAAFAVGIGILSDDFSYPDGSLVGNGGWVSHSGTLGDLLVVSGQAVLDNGSGSEDVNVPFVATPSSKLFYRFDFSVDDLGVPISGGDYEYFAHFKDDGFNYRARLDIVEALGGGDFSVGISTTTSTAEAVWPTDLTFGVTYTVVASYDQANNIAELWIDPVSDTDPSILGVDGTDPGTEISGFALRQSASSGDETIRVDNLFVSESFEPVPAETQTWGGVKSLYR